MRINDGLVYLVEGMRGGRIVVAVIVVARNAVPDEPFIIFKDVELAVGLVYHISKLPYEFFVNDKRDKQRLGDLFRSKTAERFQLRRVGRGRVVDVHVAEKTLRGAAGWVVVEGHRHLVHVWDRVYNQT